MSVLKKNFKQKKNNQIKNKLKIIGNKILEKTYNEINLY